MGSPRSKALAQLPIYYGNYKFVDVGSGKGLVLLEASRYGFEKVVSVEMPQKLNAIAKDNVEKFTRASRKYSDIETICTDALSFQSRT